MNVSKLRHSQSLQLKVFITDSFGSIGSAAAGFQAGIGNVVAPSLFATLQSAGAAGYGAAVVNGAIQAGAGVSATAFAWWGAKKKDRGETDKEENAGGDSKPGAEQD